jgi:hypothetical protein
MRRAAGVLHWGEDERHLIRKYLQEGRVDFTRLDDVDYLRGIMVGEAIWARHPPRNFYQNICRAAQAWQVNEDSQGAWARAGSRAPAGRGGHGGGRAAPPPSRVPSSARHPPPQPDNDDDDEDEEDEEDANYADDGNVAEDEAGADDAPSPAPSEWPLQHCFCTDSNIPLSPRSPLQYRPSSVSSSASEPPGRG